MILKAFLLELCLHDIVMGTEFATISVEFSFEYMLYRQIDGIVMGSPLGPAMANNFLLPFYEPELLARIENPHFYYRYVDGSFSVFDSEEQSFCGLLNVLHSALMFDQVFGISFPNYPF